MDDEFNGGNSVLFYVLHDYYIYRNPRTVHGFLVDIIIMCIFCLFLLRKLRIV